MLSPGGGAHKPEFDAWRWARFSELPDLIVPFKRPVYERVVGGVLRARAMGGRAMTPRTGS